MFRKLVSNLAYSPALITEVGFYAKRLKQEEITRKLTVLFTILALVMQSLAVFYPPESANASSEQDIIRGGVSSLDDFLIRYDHNEDDVKDIYSAAGITRSEIMSAKQTTISNVHETYIMSRYGQTSAIEHEISLSYPKSTGGIGVRYFSPLPNSVTSLRGWSGTSAALGWFAIIQSNGSLATHGIPTTINPEGVTGVSATKNISAFNISNKMPLSDRETVRTLDKISYSLKITNVTAVSVTSPLSVRVADILEYGNLIDAGGGNYETTNSTLSWPQVQLAPGESQERTFVIQLLSSLPATASGKSNPSSYDCTLTIAFGNSINSPIDCPAPKVIESLFLTLPPTSMTLNITFALIVLITVSFFYIRTRQLKKEIRIIRHNFNTGII
ncbi:MAG: hypothetical protein WAW80_00680 [Candidatus Saccharimonadales bacterium]